MVAENVVNGEILLLQGVGHYLMEELEIFHDLLVGWLDDLLKKSNKTDRGS